MFRKIHLYLFVLLIGVISVVIEIRKGHPVELGLFFHAKTIAGVLGTILVIFDFWLWRTLCRWFVSVPDIRGLWSAEAIIRDPSPTRHGVRPGFMMIRQTHSRFFFTMFWDDGTKLVSKMTDDAALSVNTVRSPVKSRLCAFSGHYSIGNEVRYFGMFFRCDPETPNELDLFYRTTEKQTGTIHLANRTEIFPTTLDQAKKAIGAKPTFYQKLKFVILPR